MQTVAVHSLEGSEVEMINVDCGAYRSWIFDDIKQFLEEMDGIDTCFIPGMITRYLNDTRWITSLKRCSHENRSIKSAHYSLLDLIDLCRNVHHGIVRLNFCDQ